MRVVDDIYGRRFYPFANDDTTPGVMAAQPYIEVTVLRNMPDFAQVKLNIGPVHLPRSKWETWKAAADAAYDLAERLQAAEEAASK